MAALRPWSVYDNRLALVESQAADPRSSDPDQAPVSRGPSNMSGTNSRMPPLTACQAPTCMFCFVAAKASSMEAPASGQSHSYDLPAWRQTATGATRLLHLLNE